MDKHTGLELHMLGTLRQIYAAAENSGTERDQLYDTVTVISNLAAPFIVTGPSDAELDKLIIEDRQSHGWPTQEPK